MMGIEKKQSEIINSIEVKRKMLSRKDLLFRKNYNDLADINEENKVDYNAIYLPIGRAKAKGAIEDFVITIYDNENNRFEFLVKDGNVCGCDMQNHLTSIEYEVN